MHKFIEGVASDNIWKVISSSDKTNGVAKLFHTTGKNIEIPYYTMAKGVQIFDCATCTRHGCAGFLGLTMPNIESILQ